MRTYKIKALIYMSTIALLNTKERLIESLLLPITTIIIWGLFANYFSAFSPETGAMLLTINIFWSFCYLAQSTANLQVNEDVWSRSLPQVLTSGVSAMEYMAAKIIFATAVSMTILAAMLATAKLFSYKMIELTALIPLITIALIASMAISIIITALFLRLGREYAFLTWTVMQLVVLFSAPFFPITTYPAILQGIVKAMPYTWVFEGLRSATQGAIQSSQITIAAAAALTYLTISIPLYLYMFKQARKSGQLARIS